MRKKPFFGCIISALILYVFCLNIFAAEIKDENEETEIVSVVLPSKVSFTINPFEADGRGQIYSDTYFVKNMGDTDIILTFSDFTVMFNGAGEFKLMAEPFDREVTGDLKLIYLTLHFERDDILPVVFGADSELGIFLEPGESLPMSFSGSVSCYPAVEWRFGDVSIHLSYSIIQMNPFGQFSDEDDEEEVEDDEESEEIDELEELEEDEYEETTEFQEELIAPEDDYEEYTDEINDETEESDEVAEEESDDEETTEFQEELIEPEDDYEEYTDEINDETEGNEDNGGIDWFGEYEDAGEPGE